MKPVVLLALVTLFLLIPAGYSSASDGQTSLADAIGHYRSARFEKAKEILIPLSGQKHEDAVIQKALIYLALIEIAYRNFEGADAYIRTLISRHSVADPEDIRVLAEDLPPAFTDRFDKILKSIDPLPPSAEMSRIQGRYPLGETVRIKITARDNRALKSLSFSVEKTDINAEWGLEGKSASVEHSFSTREWAEGVYEYRVRVSDETGNARDYQGTFAVAPPADTVKPTAEVVGIASEYPQGERIRFKIKAMDDQGLKALYFIIEGTDITREWAVEGKSASVEETLSTDGLAAGIHRYLVRIWDETDNTRDYEGTFAIAPPADATRPTAEIRQIKERYRQGETVNIEIEARDNRSLEEIVFRVLKTNTAGEWAAEGESEKVRHAFSTQGWAQGVYGYQVTVTDQAGNRWSGSGSFTLFVEARYGYVNIFTKPWTEIFIDGRSYGTTPKARLKLPAGPVSIRFINKEQEINTVRTITVRPDQLARESFEFEVKASAPAPKPKGDGYLNIVSKPWTEIYINGKAYGRTPKARLKLPAGTVTVRFVNPEKGIDETRNFTILPDQLVKKSFTFK